MLSSEKQGVIHLLKITWPYLVVTSLYTIFIFLLEEFVGDHIYKVSAQIGSVFGLAVAFFLGFRMNSAYDRWWEGRKIFGELTNNTRSCVAKIYVYCKNTYNLVLDDQTEAKLLASDLIELNIAYVNQVKLEIQNQTSSPEDATRQLYLKYGINEQNKLSNELLLAMTELIETKFSPTSKIEKGDLMQHINRFYDIQGKAERIKNTPFLKIYGAFTRIIVSFYVLLLPLFIGDIDLGGEESHYELLAIPILVLISSVFLTINKLANLFGEPFANNKTAVPINQICSNIEQNCKEVKDKLNV